MNTKIWDIQATKSALGLSLCKHLPFLHALLGCDSTSRLFGIGKSVALKKADQVEQYAEVFFHHDSSKEEVKAAGENALVAIYGGKASDTLDRLRYQKYCEKVVKNAICVEAKSLPPTSSAAKFHAYRVYYQVQTWLGNTLVNPTDWGWNVSDGVMYPYMTDIAPAPDSLLKMVKCNCKTDCKTARCSCKKHGLDCSYMLVENVMEQRASTPV